MPVLAPTNGAAAGGRPARTCQKSYGFTGCLGRLLGYLICSLVALIGDHIYNIFQWVLGANLVAQRGVANSKIAYFSLTV